MRLLNLFFIAVLLFTASCGSKKDTLTYSVEEVETPGEELSTKIVILNFDIIKSKINKAEVSLMKTEVISGRLNKSVIIYPPRELGKLVVHLLGGNQEIIEELVIKKPYVQIPLKYEDGGEEELQNDAIEKNQFSVRFNQNSNIKSIKIFKLKAERTVEIFHETIIHL
jgi:hypothetical protein